jgi:hypothetical protein
MAKRRNDGTADADAVEVLDTDAAEGPIEAGPDAGTAELAVAAKGDLVYEGPAATIHGIGAFAPGDVVRESELREIAKRLGVKTVAELASRLCGVKGFREA